MLEIVAWVLIAVSTGHYSYGVVTEIERFDGDQAACIATMNAMPVENKYTVFTCRPIYKTTESFKEEVKKANEENNQQVKELTYINSVITNVFVGQIIRVNGKEIEVTNVRSNSNFVYINGERFINSTMVVIVK
jgi:hypothetical protein